MSGSNLPKYQPNAMVHLATEAEFQRVVEEMATYLHYLVWHDRDSRKNDPGFPDLCLVGTGPVKQVVFFELKRMPKGKSRSEKEKTSATVDQVGWIQALRAARVHAYIVRPTDLDFIESVLRGSLPIPDPLSPISSEALERVLANEEEPIVRQRAPRKKGRPRLS